MHSKEVCSRSYMEGPENRNRISMNLWRKIRNGLIAVVPLFIMVLWFYRGFSGMGELISSESIEKNAVSSKTETAPKSSFILGGVQMNEWDQEKWIKALKLSGMNTAEVTVYAHQGRWNENNLWFAEDEPGVREEIKLAKRAGLKVVLILRLQLNHDFEDNNFLWHGMVFPENEYLLQLWFQEYGHFVKKWAHTAEEYDVDVLVIGSEMNAMFATTITDKLPNLQEYYLNPIKKKEYQNQLLQYKDSLPSEYLYTAGLPLFDDLETFLKEQASCNEAWALTTSFSDSLNRIHAINVRRTIHNFYWERLIYELKDIYKGKMTIAANFDNYQEVKFWDKLDYIGINAYFPLSKLKGKNNKLSQIEEFEESWDRILDEIKEFKDQNGVPNHPVIFTELGYANHSGSTLKPWQGFGFSVVEAEPRDSLFIWSRQKKDHTERNNAVRALYNKVKEKQFPLAGILYWKLTSYEHQLKYDPFAFHLGKNTSDTLQSLLLRFKTLEQELKMEEFMEKRVKLTEKNKQATH